MSAYKFYNEVKLIRRAVVVMNHNSSVITLALVKKGIIDQKDLEIISPVG